MRTASVILTLLALAPALLGADIRLRSAVLVSPDGPVLLGQIAHLTGDGAERLASLVIIEDPSAELAGRRWISVEPEHVRAAIRTHGLAPHRHTINGRACRVRVRVALSSAPETVETPERLPETVELTGPETVRTRVARTLAKRYGVGNDDLRLLFDPDPRTDALLDRPIAGCTPVVRPISSGISDRLQVEVLLMRSERVIASGTLTGIAQVRRDAAVLTTRVSSGTRLLREHLRAETRWMSPARAAEAVGIEESLGQRATNRLDPNEVVRTRDIEPPLAIRRGDSVVVITIAGGVSIETRARALDDAILGERIACRLHKSSTPFDAIVDAPGRVVVDLDARTRSGDTP